MKTMLCLFCNSQEPNYRPTPNIDFICSRSVTLLGDADQDDLIVKSGVFRSLSKTAILVYLDFRLKCKWQPMKVKEGKNRWVIINSLVISEH